MIKFQIDNKVLKLKNLNLEIICNLVLGVWNLS